MSDKAAPVPTLGARFKRFFLLLLLAVIAGPPVGSVVFFTASGIANIRSLEDAGYALLAPFVGLLFSPFSYLVGALPAALGGIVVAGWQAFLGRVSALGITAVGFILGLGFVFALEGFAGIGRSPTEWGLVIAMFLTAMLPTVACWYVVRNRYYPPLRSAQAPEQASS